MSAGYLTEVIKHRHKRRGIDLHLSFELALNAVPRHVPRRHEVSDVLECISVMKLQMWDIPMLDETVWGDELT
jgi:hypothetical protein